MNLMIQQFYRFLTACGGSWRNTVYVSCQEDGPGYLMAADRDGKPVVMAIEQFQQLSGEQIDPTECCGQLTQSAFQDIYAQYLLWQFPEDGTDVLAALSRPSKQ